MNAYLPSYTVIKLWLPQKIAHLARNSLMIKTSAIISVKSVWLRRWFGTGLRVIWKGKVKLCLLAELL